MADMEHQDSNLQLNLVGFGGKHIQRQQKKRSQLSKRERLTLKRQRSSSGTGSKDQSNAITLVDDNTAGSSTGYKQKQDGPDEHFHPPPKKTSSQHAKQSASKFSALFTKNPEIPRVQSSNVTPMEEQVFTGGVFEDLNLHPFMVSNLKDKMGFSEMTSVQKAAIPKLLNGLDVLIKSQTGSGKTLAYAVPLVENLRAITPKIARSDGVHAIVLVPTRELVLQSCDTFTKLTRPFTWVVPGALMGGEKRKAEKARLRKGINIIIATPGRLLDHLQHTNSLVLDKLSWFVIDEADRLFDLGFEKDVKSIVKMIEEKTSNKRQNVLLSATLSEGVEHLAGMSLNNPVCLDITSGPQDSVSPNPTDGAPEDSKNLETKSQLRNRTERKEKFATPSSLSHYCVVVPNKLRLVTLASFLLEKCKFSRNPCKMVVFLATQDLVEFHHYLFLNCLKEENEDDDEDEEDNNDWLFKLHGEMAQKERTKVFQEFHKIKSGVLLCTDVAARGLDLPNVHWIVQFNPPPNSADYIHRSGRTARAGSQGRSLLFLTPAEVDYIQVINDKDIKLEAIDMNDMFKFLRGNVIQLLGGTLTGGQIPRTDTESAIALQMKMENFVDAETDARTAARKAYQSFIRAYTTFPSSLKPIFNMKNLHLGHVAKSFCLAEAPKKIGAVMGTHMSKEAKEKKKRKRSNLFNDDEDVSSTKRSRPKKRKFSEFDSGFEGAVMMGKHKKKKIKK